MATAVVEHTKVDPARLDALVGRAVNDLAAGYAGVLVSIGHRLGLYRVMAGAGPLNAYEVAARAKCAERYVREWLNAQVAGGYVDYHPVSDSYELSPEQAMILANADSPVFLPEAWNVPASMWHDEDKAIEAFRTGGGVAWGDHHHRLHHGVAAFYRNAYRAGLVSEWLPALDGVVERLEQGITVADVGCGHGHSAIVLAQAFPRSRVMGFDTHPESIAHARRNAEEAGVANRVEFQVAGATGYGGATFDLICFFDSLHDMGDPIAGARHAKASLAPGGTVLLVEPFAGDRVQDNIGPVGRLYYVASTLLCCAHAMSEGGTLVLGAQAGEGRLAEVFRRGGFSRFRRASQTPFNLILEARP